MLGATPKLDESLPYVSLVLIKRHLDIQAQCLWPVDMLSWVYMQPALPDGALAAVYVVKIDASAEACVRVIKRESFDDAGERCPRKA